MQLQKLDWKDILASASYVHDYLQKQPATITSIYGIPRGGLPYATVLSNYLNIPLILNRSQISSTTLIVDDILDTGHTAVTYKQLGARYFAFLIATEQGLGRMAEVNIVSKPVMKTDWAVFPWEHLSQAEKDIKDYQDRLQAEKKGIPLNEIFYTIQSEGDLAGTPALFIRTQFCGVQCKWCDTKHTWAKLPKQEVKKDVIVNKTIDDINKKWSYFTPKDIYKECQKYGAKLVVITGGEPCYHDLTSLTSYLHSKGIACQIETSGTQYIKDNGKSVICISPKIDVGNKNVTVIKEAWNRASYLKMVITDKYDLERFDKILKEYGHPNNCNIYLQPESTKPESTQFCIDICKQRNWKLSIQYHKYINIR